MDTKKISQLITKHEGKSLFPYKDSVGKLTIGVGRNIDPDGGIGLSEDEVAFLLLSDINRCLSQLIFNCPYFKYLSEVRQAVLVDMLFNLGWPRFNRFALMECALIAQDYDRAADEMIKSRWRYQVGNRAIELAHMMRSDRWPIL